MSRHRYSTFLTLAILAFGAAAEDKLCTLPGDAGQYVLSLPPGYDAKKEYELIVALHGAGDPPEHFVKALRSLMPDRACILAAPLSKDVKAWTPEELSVVAATAADVAKQCQIKKGRVVLFGFSAGCWAGFFVVAEQPGVFNGFLSFGEELDADEISDEKLAPGKGVPIFYSVGTKDRHYAASVETAARLKRLGFNVTHDTPAGIGHTITPDQVKRALAWLDDVLKKKPEKDDGDKIRIGGAQK